MDAETQILSRLAANHIHLAQFEPLRAILIALRSRSPDVALAILQTIVARAGRLEKVVWSPSCSSPSILTYLSTLELLQFDNASSAWSFDSEALRLRAEFLLLVQSLIDRISDSMQKNIVLEGIEREAEKEVLREKDNIGKLVTSLGNGNGKLNECLLILDKILELGVKRLSVDRVLGVEVNGSGSESWTASLSLIEEGKLVPLNKVIWEYADTFDALCWNIQRQVKGCDQYNSSLAITVRKDELAMNQMEDLGEGEDIKVLALIQRSVQQAHLNDLKQCLKEGNVDEAISRICFLHFDYGVEEPEYREVLKELLKIVVLIKEGSGGCWHGMRENLFLIYGEALSSNCMQLVQMIQNIHDDLLSEEVERQIALDNNEIPPPLKCFLSFMADLEFDINVDTKPAALDMAITSCLRDIYHYARVSGLHILECVLNGALSAVNKGQLHEASNVLVLFPRLQPLVAAMGWDLLSGKTTERRQLMQLLWISKSPGSQQEVSSLASSQIEEISCVEYLCESLCYQLDLASFVACVNSGHSWNSKCSLLLARKEQLVFERDSYSDSFVENFVLERLSVQSPIRVLFDVVPGIKFEDSIELIKMQPISSSVAALKRTQDVELIHMRYALESVVLSLGAMESCLSAEREYHKKVPFFHLNDLRSHLESITSVSRKILMVNVIISLLHMDDFSLSKTHSASPRGSVESPYSSSWEQFDLAEGGNKIVIVFTGSLLDILQCNLPSGVTLDDSMNFGLSIGGKQAIEWRVSIAKRFIEEWQWRLSILQRLLPFSERQWRWKEALTILRAAPSKLLNLCMQKAKYDIGEEAVHRFSLSAEDKATLELADWVDSAFKRPSVEDVVSRAAGTAEGQDIDFSSLRSQLGPLGAILLCIDIAATSTRSAKMSQQLLHQAQVMLSEIYPGVPPKIGHNYWDQIHEVGVISVSRRVLKRMLDFLEQDNSSSLQAILSGEVIISSTKDLQRKGQRDRALAMLHQMIEDAHIGKRQFLSGKLHNLARAVADEEADTHFLKGEESQATDRTVLSNVDTDGILGLGFKVGTKVMLSTTAGETSMSSSIYDVKDSGKRIFGPLSIKPTTYLSRFILHIAAIGDIVDGTDSTHDFNFFSLVYEWPKDLLTQLVFDRGSTDAASKVAEIMCADFVHEVISACVPPVYPPRFGPGWACIPVIPICSTGGSDIKVLSPSSKEAKQNCYIRSSATPGVPLYPLQLDVVKHLVKISPVRSVLACVFGSSILYSGSNSSVSSSLNDGLLQAPDADQLFYELALDQSERFPTLNRWIQMQTNRHRVSEFAVATKPDAGDSDKGESKASIKRLRDFDSDTESEIDDLVGNNSISTTFPVLTGQDNATQDPSKGWSRPEVSKRDNTAFLSFDWENEEPYEKAVERLIDDGKLMDALALSDRFLRNGASDQLLHLLIVCEEARDSISEESRDYGCQSISCNSWQYCLRLKDKQLAATLALKYMHKWELDASLDVLTMCACHLAHNDPIRNEVVQVKQALQKYSRILSADDHYKNWQEVEAVFKEDPEGLALRLAGKGAVSAALEVAESAELSIDLRRELQGRQLVKLLTADPLDGGGPAEASRFLSSLRDSDDALPVAVGAMQLLPNLRSKQLLVHFFLKRRDGNLSDVEVSRLNSWALGLRVLAALPLPWQQRCSSLHEHPHLIIEVLLMRKQLHSASVILKEFPSLRDNNTIFTYAAKAIAVSVSSPPREHRVSVSGNRPKQKMRAGASGRSSFSSSFSNLQKEARRALSWTPRSAGDKAAPKDTYKKRKSSGLTPSERVAWEAMTGIQEDRVLVYSADGQERISSISIAEEWMLTGDAMKDESVRGSHRYESAPDVTLFKALLSLCTDELASAKSAMDLCISQMKKILNSQLLPENASMEIIGRAYYATETFVQGLLYAKSLLRKLVSGSDLSSNSEKSRDADDASSDAGSSNVGSQSDELSEVLSQADTWLGRAELLQSLLGSGIAASLDDIADVDSSAHLRDRLIMEERYSMAVYTSKKCKIDVFPVWNAWGHALIRIEHYAQARVKFKQAFQLYKGDLMPVIQEIINTIEGGPQVDVSAVRSMYEHLAKSAPTILDDSLSADAYLNVLHMPSTFPRSERSRRSQQSANTNSIYGSDFDDGPRSNLDSIRYVECVNYLQEYARQLLLGFMFRHGHYKDACMLFFPSDAIPSPQPSSVGAVTSSLSPQRVDPLATDYGTIDDLCELCVSNGAMDVLEEVLSTRMSSSKPQDVAVNQYIAAALGRICTFCENYKHFNYLYRFQVIKKDHVGAGLCCIQLFMNSISQEEAIKHLEHAKMHFDEGLSVRNKGGDYTKLVTKTVRGKSASEKLSEEGLVKFSARVSIQIEVVKSFNDSEGPQWKHSVFGNPNDPETFRRRCKIAETLVEKNFDLAFQVIYQFDLPAVDIYAAVAASLAERKKGGQLTEFFRNIKGTIEDEDWDQVLGAAISVYANKHKERPDRLIDMLKSSHRKVLACVVCGRLKSAFQLAAQSGSVADVQYVAHQALHANALPVLDMCKQWLAKYM